MRLSKAIKDQIVRAIMADVPNVDYRQQARCLIREYNIGRLPKEVRALIGTKNEPFIRTNYQSFAGAFQLGSFQVFWTNEGDLNIDCKETSRKLIALCEKHNQQASERKQLKAKLEATLINISTLKRAIEVLPEFEKYFPSEKAPTPNLPATKELVDSFRNAGLKV